jgi:small multidrug resistance pump
LRISQDKPKDVAPRLAHFHVDMNRPFLFLVGAVGFEVLWAVMLKVAAGFTRPWASAVMALSYLLSLLFLNLACRHLDLSLAYAIWTGSGATLVAIIGVFVFREPLSIERAIGFLLVIAGLVVLLGFEPRTSFGEAIP